MVVQRFWKYICGLALVLSLALMTIAVWYLLSRTLSPRNAVRNYSLPLEDVGIITLDSDTFSVGCFNIAHARGGEKGATNWQKRTEPQLLRHLDKIAAQVKQWQPDIIVLNEVDFSSAWSFHVNQARYIAERAGYPYVVEQRNMDIGFPFYRFKFGNAILSRYPVIESEFIKFPPYSSLEDMAVGNHDGVFSVLQTSLGRVGLIAVHLEYRSEKIRVDCVEVIKKIADRYTFPVIAAGDFNSTPIPFTGARLTASGDNALTYLLSVGNFEAFSGIRDHRSFYTFPSEQPATVIDWIIEQGELGVVSSDVVKSTLSDHNMVVASLKMETVEK